jgi:hypothetical protein
MSMMLGLSFETFTLMHVAISLVAIVAGLPVLVAMLRNGTAAGATALFLGMTVLTSVTGFMFPSATLLPSHIVGVVSLAALAVAMAALYGFRLAGVWRPAYVVAAVLSLYLNVFVLVVQAFQKVAPLKALAPTQSEPPFLAAQAALLALFGYAGFLAFRRFRD